MKANGFLFLLISTLVIIIIIVIIKRNRQTINESFSNSPALIFNVELDTRFIHIMIDHFDEYYHPSYDFTSTKYRNVIVNKENSKRSPDVIVTDMFSFKNKYSNMKLINVIPSVEKVCMFLKPKDHINNQSLKMIIEEKAIGYVNDIDQLIVKNIALSLRIDLNKLKLVRVDKKNIYVDQNLFDKYQIYTLFLFSALSNNWLKNIIDTKFLIDFMVYEDMDFDIIKFKMPFVKKRAIDLSIAFKNFQDAMYQVKTCLFFDIGVLANENLSDIKRPYIFLNQMIEERVTQQEVLNYYSMYLDIFYLYREKFQNPLQIYEIKVTYNIQGYYFEKDKRLQISKKESIINGIQLTYGSIVILQNQNRKEENGIYIYTKKGLQKHLIINDRLIFNKDNEIDITNIIVIDSIPVRNIKSGFPIYLTRTDEFALIIKRKGKTILKRKLKSIENPYTDIRYDCYGDSKIKNKGFCDSEFDPSGNWLKQRRTYWDRRCETNEECPYFQKNKNYKNYFGGCVDGHCQMPVGVKSVSYRLPDPNTKPMCYNCKDNDPFCCEDQKNRKLYPHLNSPDYAYPLDSYSRFKYFGKNNNKSMSNESIEKFAELKDVFTTISVLPEFYKESAKPRYKHYALEFEAGFFLQNLIHKQEFIPVSNQAEYLNNTDLLNKIDNLIIKLLNKALESAPLTIDADNKFVINKSYIQEFKIEPTGTGAYQTRVISYHIVFRYTKLYGINLKLETIHNHENSIVNIVNVTNEGFIFEDKLESVNVTPFDELEKNEMNPKPNQEDEILSVLDNKEEKLKAYYDKMKKQRGISWNAFFDGNDQ